MLSECTLKRDKEFLLAEELDVAPVGIVIRQNLNVHKATRITRNVIELGIQAVTVDDQAPHERAVSGVAVLCGYGRAPMGNPTVEGSDRIGDAAVHNGNKGMFAYDLITVREVAWHLQRIDNRASNRAEERHSHDRAHPNDS